MTYIRMMIHCVWSTKNREPQLVNKDYRIQLFEHIRIHSYNKGIYIDTIGGDKEHVHCLISLGGIQNIAKIIQLIKGESSFWFNKKGWNTLQWQDDYFAVSIGESQVDIVRRYIHNQEEHHKRKSFDVEYKEFLVKYNFQEKDKKKFG